LRAGREGGREEGGGGKRDGKWEKGMRPLQ